MKKPTTKKVDVTLLLDRDILKFFRGKGRRYKRQINHILRIYMLAHVRFEPNKPTIDGIGQTTPPATARMTQEING